MITGKEIKVLDKNSEYFGVPTSTLMENAGKGVAEFIINTIHPRDNQIIVFCGTGNNGGDGFVAARYLTKKYKTSIFLTGEEKDIKTKISKENYVKLKNQKTKIYTLKDIKKLDKIIEENDIIIDSMLGIGLTGNLKEPYNTIVKQIKTTKNKIIISIDIPTGLGTNNTIKPNYTVTFHDVKEGMNKNNSGEIHMVDIGISKEAEKYVGPGELSVYYPRPEKQSHKGDNGTVLVVGGGPYTGAAALSAMAALRTGADLAYIATPKKTWQIIASYSPDLIVKDLNSDILTEKDQPIIQELTTKCDSIVIGPGLGNNQETKKAIQKIIKHATTKNKALVIDADAIKPTGEKPEMIKNSKTVITPHKGEFQELTGIKLSENIDKNVKTVEKWAAQHNITILLKGPIDIITDGKQTKLNKTHNEAMTVGGTGDVLAGITGALLAKNMKPYNAATTAAFLNGAAGNESYKKYSYGLLATDIIKEIPNILKKYLQTKK